MQTKHLCVLIHNWTKGEVGAPLNRFMPLSKILLLTVSKAVILLWIIYVISVLFCYAFMRVCFWCLVVSCWERADLLALSFVMFIVTLSLSHWYPVSDVVLDCIDSWYLPSFLLCQCSSKNNKLIIIHFFTDNDNATVLHCIRIAMVYKLLIQSYKYYLTFCLL